MSDVPYRGWFDVRPPRGGVAFYAGCLIIIAVLLLTSWPDDFICLVICPILLTLGIGLWLKHSWARWVTFSFFSLVTLALVARMVTGDVSFRHVARLLVVMSSVYTMWRWDVWPPPSSGELLWDEEEDDPDAYAEEYEAQESPDDQEEYDEDYDDEYDQYEEEYEAEGEEWDYPSQEPGSRSFWDNR
jgi:hypothetical protein